MPSPDGQELAIVVTGLRSIVAAGEPFETTGIVVSTRSGGVKAVVAAGAISGVAWSPRGGRLGYCAGYPDLRFVSEVPGGPAKVVHLPADIAQTEGLVWSPDGAEVICAGVRVASQATTWTVVNVATGKAETRAGPGNPVAWLPGSQRPGGTG
jgi:hypothetical protein